MNTKDAPLKINDQEVRKCITKNNIQVFGIQLPNRCYKDGKLTKRMLNRLEHRRIVPVHKY